jgi:hypothetical protein
MQSIYKYILNHVSRICSDAAILHLQFKVQVMLLPTLNILYFYITWGARGGAVAEALRYKPEGRGIDSRWCHWNFSLT